MDPAEVHICFYHGNCHDGALAAAIVKQKTNPACEFVPTWWDSLPVKPTVAGKNVLFVDLTPSPKVLAEVLAKARAVFIIDHHESAHAILVTQMPLSMLRFDVAECGASLAWKWIHGEDAPFPPLLKYIKALDMFDWTALLAADPAARSLSRCIEQLVSPTVPDMEDALVRGDAFIDTMRASMHITDTIIERQIDRCMGSVEYSVWKGADHIRIAVLNSQHFINHIAFRVYSNTSVHVVWVWYRHGGSQSTRVMLRSNGRFDCQQYALTYGGGGHANAAMFCCKSESSMWSHLWI